MIPRSSPALTTFQPFPRLPTELRLKIWSLAVTAIPPQTFTITTHKIRQPRTNRLTNKTKMVIKHRITTIHATARPPSLFQTSQEARFQALEHYTQIPSTRVLPIRSVEGSPPDPKYVFVNFSMDIFDVERISYWYVEFVLCHIPCDPSWSLKRIQRLRTVAKDVLWFGEDFGRARLDMMDELREVEIRVLEGASDGLDAEDRGVRKLVSSFERARRKEPGWVFPRVTIVEDDEVLKVYEGGVWSEER